ncbi:bactofilin family protein [Acidimangrovimonas pyrenivorans]|uniref:Polymer-forming cytoskeletal protein n=1 Tax=Acidimangrovimonas pyrenivorans TaxID=2030798 RepID=A0ABV7AJU1_9RHOB
MLTKSGETTSHGTEDGGRGRSRLSQDLQITGNLKSSGTIEVLGEVKGDIEAGKLVIGSDGTVTGKVRAETVEVMGTLDGSASCVGFTLRSTARATAQVTYESLVIENGARIEGKFKLGKKG